MLRKRMNADDNMRTPLLENVAAEADAAALKEFAGLGPEPVHCPVDIFHPALLVAKYPVVNAHKLVRHVMRFLDRLDNPNGDRFAMPKSLQTHRQRVGSRTVSAAGVR